MMHFSVFVSCVDLVTYCTGVEHKPLRAFIEAIISSHLNTASESPSGDKVVNTVWLKSGKQVSLVSECVKLNAIHFSNISSVLLIVEIPNLSPHVILHFMRVGNVAHESSQS